MPFALVLLGEVLLFASVAGFAAVLAHAFRRSLGTGFMVLCIPVYQLVYGFTQFEHRRKGVVLALWLGGFVGGLALRAMGLGLGAS